MDGRALTLGFTLMEGPLSKWVNVVRGWQFRWFVLDPDSGLLTYYENQAQLVRGERRGCLRLKSAYVGIDDQDDCTFTLTTCGKTFYFQSKNNEERTRWVTALSDTISRLAAIGRLEEVEDHTSTLAKFDKKIRETDVYLQILMQQLDAADKRVEQLAQLDETRVHYSHIHDSVARVVEYLKQAIVFLQICKQNTISPLDEALVRSMNANAGTSPKLSPQQARKHSPSTQNKPSASLQPPGLARKSISTPNTPTEHSAATPASISAQRLTAVEEMDRPGTLNGVPSRPTPASASSGSRSQTAREGEFVYSSGEEDDEFFDADENEADYDSQLVERAGSKSNQFQGSATTSVGAPATTPPTLARPAQTRPTAASDAGRDAQSSPGSTLLISNVIAADDDEYDELYDEVVEEDLSTSSQEGSVIMHLVKQVRIGMDLTKITLPTFILEKRSTLEMYADFFAHPDIWSAIADQPTPRDRLVQTLRWYMSAFHAGRRSSVAKKPYNPILGEIFLCFWDVSNAELKQAKQAFGSRRPESSSNPSLSDPSFARSPAKSIASESDEALAQHSAHDTPEKAQVTQKLLSGGPVAARSGTVTFISEQVSHHPPVSAFYAENAEKRMMLTGSIWTKSKFLGLSIAVEMLGVSDIHLIDYDEHYTVNFPTGYGRNILGQPWIELGGQCEIRCAKTGYYATVEFKTVPIYGGKRNRIKADAYQPGDKKPFLTVEGEWNDKMLAKWATGRQEIFVDTNNIPIVKKRVQTRVTQATNESRRLWEDVTRSLKLRKIDDATRYKQALETKQRMEAKAREMSQTVWQPIHFALDDAKRWYYLRPLTQRLQKLTQTSAAGTANTTPSATPSTAQRKTSS